MATIKVQNGQSIFDIALQHCGDVSAAFDIAVLNDILLTDALAAGQSLAIPAVVNTDVVNYYKSRGIVPATAYIEFIEPVVPVAVKYGVLYNKAAAKSSMLISSAMASAGWHLPSGDEWEPLVKVGTGVYGYIKETGYEYWLTPNTNAENRYNFKLRGAGMRRSDGAFLLGSSHVTESLKSETHLYCSNDKYIAITNSAYNNNIVGDGTIDLYTYRLGKSVRLCRPVTVSEQLLADGSPCDYYIGNDGKAYNTIKIGSLVWLGDNLCETKWNDGTDIQEVTDNSQWAALTTPAMCAYNNDWTNVLL